MFSAHKTMLSTDNFAAKLNLVSKQFFLLILNYLYIEHENGIIYKLEVSQFLSFSKHIHVEHQGWSQSCRSPIAKFAYGSVYLKMNCFDTNMFLGLNKFLAD
jgi:hypothetical protein